MEGAGRRLANAVRYGTVPIDVRGDCRFCEIEEPRADSIA